MPIAILSALIKLIELGITVEPQVIAAARIVVSLIESGASPTPDQQAQIDAALDTAHAALQEVTHV
jgi:hypothetical protein